MPSSSGDSSPSVAACTSQPDTDLGRRTCLAARIWNIPHVQRAIVLHSQRGTRARLLRVSRGLFNNFAWAVYSEVEWVKLSSYLQCATLGHQIVYSRAVRSITAVNSDHRASFAELFMRFPGLRSLEVRDGTIIARTTWRRADTDPYVIESDSMAACFDAGPSSLDDLRRGVKLSLPPAGILRRHLRLTVCKWHRLAAWQEPIPGFDAYSLCLATSDLARCQQWIDAIVPAKEAEIESVEVTMVGWPKRDVVACFDLMLKATSNLRVTYDRETLAGLEPLGVLELCIEQIDCVRQFQSLHLEFNCVWLGCSLEEALVNIGLLPRGICVGGEHGRGRAPRNLVSLEVRIDDYACPQQLVGTWIPLIAKAMFHIGGMSCVYALHVAEEPSVTVSQSPVYNALFRKEMEGIVQDYCGRGEPGWRKLDREERVSVAAPLEAAGGEAV